MPAEKVLRKLESSYSALFNSIPIGMSVATYDGRVLAGNDFLLKLTGYSEEEIKQINLVDVYLNPEDRTRLLHQVQYDGFVRNFETVLKRKDGAFYFASLTMTPFTLDGHEVLLAVIEDISDSELK